MFLIAITLLCRTFFVWPSAKTTRVVLLYIAVSIILNLWISSLKVSYICICWTNQTSLDSSCFYHSIGFIEKNTFSSLRDNFEYYKKNLVLIQRDPATITTKKATETSKQLSGILPASRDSKDQPKPVESDQNLIKPTISPLESIGGESEESDEEVSIQDDNTKEMNLSGNKSFRIFLAL